MASKSISLNIKLDRLPNGKYVVAENCKDPKNEYVTFWDQESFWELEAALKHIESICMRQAFNEKLGAVAPGEVVCVPEGMMKI